MTTLEYVKVILEKVSFDTKLFEKELTKAIQSLETDEQVNLLHWCEAQFCNEILEIVFQCFSSQKQLVA